MPRLLELAHDAVVVDDLAERVRRLAGGRGLLGLVDRLADAVAEAGALGDADAPGRFPCVDYRTGPRSDPSAGRCGRGFRGIGGDAVDAPLARGQQLRDAPHDEVGREALGGLRRSVPGGSSSARRNGRPTRTVTRPPGCGSFWPRGQTPFEPPIPIGTIGAPVRSASTATPSRGRLERAVGAPRPLREDEQDVALVEDALGQPERLDIGRIRGRPGGRRRAAPSSRRPASRTAPSCRASGSAGRASGSATHPARRDRSSRRGWTAMITGPSRGISSIAPSIRMRRMARAKIRAPKATAGSAASIALSMGSVRAGRPTRARRSGRHLVGHRRASASRIALATAATVSSNVLPSVEMIRASVAGRSGATRRFRSSSSRRRRAAEDLARPRGRRGRGRAPRSVARPAPPPTRRGRS